MKLKKRKARSRLRGARTCGYGSRKKHRGKGSRGGKGMAGTGKRAGQKITLLIKEGIKLGKRGFVSKKKLKRLKKQKVINLKDLIYKIGNTSAEEINLNNFKIVGFDVGGFDESLLEILKKTKIKKIVCEGISANAKKLLEGYGIEIVTEEKKEKEGVKREEGRRGKEGEEEGEEREVGKKREEEEEREEKGVREGEEEREEEGREKEREKEKGEKGKREEGKEEKGEKKEMG